MTGCDFCTLIGGSAHTSQLARHLRPDQAPVVAENRAAVAVPTIGAFSPGYLLVVPRRHTPSLGLLTRNELDQVEALAGAVRQQLSFRYGRPVIGFEYGLNDPQARRISHSHLHLLPSAANLTGWLDRCLAGRRADGFRALPSDPTSSYITVWDAEERLRVYPVANDAKPRIRLREVVAHLDERLPAHAWDWEAHPYTDQIRRTVDDLAGSPLQLHEEALR